MEKKDLILKISIHLKNLISIIGTEKNYHKFANPLGLEYRGTKKELNKYHFINIFLGNKIEKKGDQKKQKNKSKILL